MEYIRICKWNMSSNIANLFLTLIIIIVTNIFLAEGHPQPHPKVERGQYYLRKKNRVWVYLHTTITKLHSQWEHRTLLQSELSSLERDHKNQVYRI
jgi:hypothetical protein